MSEVLADKKNLKVLADKKNLESKTELSPIVSILESLFFASEKALSLNAIKGILEDEFSIASVEIKKHIKNLQNNYENQDRGIELAEVNNTYQLRTKIKNKTFVKALIKAKSFRLSASALESLSIIAYKQPCIKASVDEVRGMDSSHLVRSLMDRGLVKFSGKSELPGKPMLYSTTDKFLEVFGLNKIMDLPELSEVQDLLPQDILDSKKTDNLSLLANSLQETKDCNDVQDQEELDKLAKRLSSIEVTTKVLKEKKDSLDS